MSYDSSISRKAAKRLKQFPQPLRGCIEEAIETINQFPHDGEPLQGNFQGFFKVRVGKYRIIYEIDEAEKQVLIGVIDSRGSSYR